MSENKKNIIIVDDNPTNLKVLYDILDTAGYRVRPTASGSVALESLFKEVPDLILLDINMPEMNGFELCGKIKDSPQFSDIPVMFISALESTEDKVTAFKAGGVDYITKPFQAEEVLSRVDTHIQIHTLQKKLKMKSKELEDANSLLEKRVEERTKNLKKEIEKRIITEAELKNSLDEKTTLLKEIHHRVKNNMQIISSLLELQSSKITDPDAINQYHNFQKRIRSMALVHEKMYRTGNLSKIPFDDYIQELIKEIANSLIFEAISITFTSTMKELCLNLEQAIPCGLILNELINNSIKHAFSDSKEGKIEVSVNSDDNKIRICVADNGKGFNSDLKTSKTASLGMMLIQSLSDQIQGEYMFNTTNGTEFILTFPIE